MLCHCCIHAHTPLRTCSDLPLYADELMPTPNTASTSVDPSTDDVGDCGAADGTDTSDSGEPAPAGAIYGTRTVSTSTRIGIRARGNVRARRAGAADATGAALYLLGSLFNHSCVPNVAARWHGSNVVSFYTLCDVAPGEVGK